MVVGLFLYHCGGGQINHRSRVKVGVHMSTFANGSECPRLRPVPFRRGVIRSSDCHYAT